MQPLDSSLRGMTASDGRWAGRGSAADAAASALIGWDWWLPDERESCQRFALGIPTADDSPDRAWLAQLRQEAAGDRKSVV